MPEETDSKTDRFGGLRQLVWYAVLVWTLGIFYHFYQSTGLFTLLGQLLEGGL